jgi:hypothetical protein
MEIKTMRIVWVVIVTVALLITGCTQALKPKPNVLFISIDDLNDWTGALKGHPQVITPNLD